MSVLLLCGLFGSHGVRAQVVRDDFDDGDDSGWTRASPLVGVGGSVAYTFPGGDGYRIASAVSPDAAALGPARAGSYRGDESYSDFHVEVDVVGWDAALDQDIGLLARVSSPGLGTLNGYAWSYQTGVEEVYLSRITGEVPTTLGSVPVLLTPGVAYRFVFEGFGDLFCGRIFRQDDPATPLATVVAFDDTYATGFGGIFNNAVSDAGTTDTTFDNYRSTPDTDIDKDGMTDQWEIDYFGELFWFDDEDFDGDRQTNLEEFIGGSDPTDAGSLSGLTSVELAGGEVVVRFPRVDGRHYLLRTSPDLENWTDQPGAALAEEGANASLTLPTGGQSPLFVQVVATVE